MTLRTIIDFGKAPEHADFASMKSEFEALFDLCRTLFCSGNPVSKCDADQLLACLDILFGVRPDTNVFDVGEDDFSQRYLHYRMLVRAMLHVEADPQFLKVDSVARGAILYFFERLAVFFGLDISSFPKIVDGMRDAFIERIAKTLGRERRSEAGK